MSEDKYITPTATTATPDAGDAVGVPAAHWFIAIVGNRTEKTVARRLAALGIETYLPIQQELHIWQNGRRAKVDTILIPSRVFVRCTEQQRRQIVNLPYINRFMVDRAAAPTAAGTRPIARVNPDELRQLQFMLGATNEKLTFTDHYVAGQAVRVVRGPLRGLSGTVVHDAPGTAPRLHIHLTLLGTVSVAISPLDIDPA